jgi:hypothetical protein
MIVVFFKTIIIDELLKLRTKIFRHGFLVGNGLRSEANGQGRFGPL